MTSAPAGAGGRLPPEPAGLWRVRPGGCAPFFVFDPRHLDVDVDTVEQRPEQAFLAAGDGGGGAGARLS